MRDSKIFSWCPGCAEDRANYKVVDVWPWLVFVIALSAHDAALDICQGLVRIEMDRT